MDRDGGDWGAVGTGVGGKEIGACVGPRWDEFSLRTDKINCIIFLKSKGDFYGKKRSSQRFWHIGKKSGVGIGVGTNSKTVRQRRNYENGRWVPTGD